MGFRCDACVSCGITAQIIEIDKVSAMPRPKIAFVASPVPIAQSARADLAARYGDVAQEKADVIVALGGDGFMLQTLHGTQSLGFGLLILACLIPVGDLHT